MTKSVLLERAIYSRNVLENLRSEIQQLPDLKDLKNLCIYVTGSFARSEASIHSDLDIFFINNSGRDLGPVQKLKKVLVDADIIRVCRRLGLPEFSNDGQFLEIHELSDIKEKLGSPADDFDNLFTARMLLLLESISVYNDEQYERILQKIVESYYRDYHDHEKNFIPLFLVNDIIRFWKTLCLNYEHRRNRTNKVSDEAKNKNHLKNLKLKFSRLLTCFSTILFLSKNHAVISPQMVIDEVKHTATERLQRVCDGNSRTRKKLKNAMSEYEWFLQITGKTNKEVIEWVSVSENRDEGFQRARIFGKNIFELLQEITKDGDTMRYIVI